MSTGKIWQIESSSSEDTFAIGEKLGKLCKGGEIFVLGSDLGGGKTVLVKGLAKGLGCQGIVSSPTFTISQVYSCRQGLSLHHFDFYRLNEPGLVPFELVDVIDNPKTITVIEWGDIVEDVLPKKRIRINLERKSENEFERMISIDCPQEMSHLQGAFS